MADTDGKADRLNIEEYGCLLSLVGKSRSEDFFTRCSAVGISLDKRVLGISYNGLSHGAEVPNWMKLEENRAKKSQFYIHAEANLFSLVKRKECDLLCLNISPCIQCCNIIAAHSVRKVVYLKEYAKCDKFKEFFKFHGVEFVEIGRESKDRIFNYLCSKNNFEELL